MPDLRPFSGCMRESGGLSLRHPRADNLVVLGLPAGLHQGPVQEEPSDRRVFRVMSRGSIWRALAGSPCRFLLSSWPWRSLAYLLSTILVAAAALIAILPVLLFPPALVL